MSEYTLCLNMIVKNESHIIEQTLIDLGKRYDGRLLDRFFKMFNIIGFTGKSKRR